MVTLMGACTLLAVSVYLAIVLGDPEDAVGATQ